MCSTRACGNPRLVRLAQSGVSCCCGHIGSATLEGRLDMGNKVMINIKAFYEQATLCPTASCPDAVRVKRNAYKSSIVGVSPDGDCRIRQRNSPSRPHGTRIHPQEAAHHPSPKPTISRMTSSAISDPITPVSAPDCPASAQAGNCSDGGGSEADSDRTDFSRPPHCAHVARIVVSVPSITLHRAGHQWPARRSQASETR